MKYVDLFAGCGGLSLGVERAGGELVLAIEKSSMAARTYYHNHVARIPSDVWWERYLKRGLHEQLSGKVVVSELKNVLEDNDAMSRLAAEDLDLVVGGPPCQGFSLAGRRNSDDVRNKLPYEFLDFVSATQPKMVIIENVVGMSHKFTNTSEAPFEQLKQALRDEEYLVQGLHLNAMHFGAPQHRPRLMIIGIRSDVAKQIGLHLTTELHVSNFRDAQFLPEGVHLFPQSTRDSWDVRTVADAISDLQSTDGNIYEYNNQSYRVELGTLKDWGISNLGEPADILTNHDLRRHLDKTKSRFRLYQWIRDSSLSGRVLSGDDMPERVAADLEKKIAVTRFPLEAPDGTEIASSSAQLRSELYRLRTKKHSQRALSWNKPARTVVTLPDDYVHPQEARIFTVRELARFQGFPDDFEFQDKETTGAHRRKIEVPQYSQVGNAVSPFMAYSVGLVARRILRAYSGRLVPFRSECDLAVAG